MQDSNLKLEQRFANTSNIFLKERREETHFPYDINSTVLSFQLYSKGEFLFHKGTAESISGVISIRSLFQNIYNVISAIVSASPEA